MLPLTRRAALASLCALSFGLSAVAGDASAQSRASVMVGGSSDFDACGGNGEIVGLDPNGDNFLSVRATPDARGAELDRLHEGDQVFLCDDSGRWIGIIYGDGSCGVTGPDRDRKPYNGGCRSGWVFGAYVRQIAG